MLSLELKIAYVCVLVIASLIFFKKPAIAFWLAAAIPLLSIAYGFPKLIFYGIAGATAGVFFVISCTDKKGMLLSDEIKKMGEEYSILLTRWRISHYFVAVLGYVLTIGLSVLLSEVFYLERLVNFNSRSISLVAIVSFMIFSLAFMAFF